MDKMREKLHTDDECKIINQYSIHVLHMCIPYLGVL